MFNNLNQLIILILSLLFAVTLHEVTHGYAAYRMGDDTAKRLGRLTLNPIKHLDFIGSLVLPIALFITGAPFIFGYAKPVPVNFANLRDIKKGMILVSSAGVLANFGVAILSGGLFQTMVHFQWIWYGTIFRSFFQDLLSFAGYSVMINTVLAVFNLMPIPPLDGSKILIPFLPVSLRIAFAKMEHLGMIIIFFLLITDSLSRFTLFFITPLINFLLGR